ncbi:MAG: beta-propeller fold lactonase family protein [Armatimonadetes bacterium]|nr:beta-propeller fold lactonase family protein [Armatimonadota bacterium]
MRILAWLLALLLLSSVAGAPEPLPGGPLLGVACRPSGTLNLVSLVDLRLVGSVGGLVEPRAIAASPDGRWVLAASGSEDLVQVVDLDVGEMVYPIRSQYTLRPADVAFSSDGQAAYILSAGLKAVVEVVVPSWAMRRVLPLHGPAPRCFAVAGNRMLVVHEQKFLSEVDLAQWKVVRQDAFAEEIGSVAWSEPKDLLLVTAPSRNLALIYRLSSREGVLQVPTGEDPGAVRVSADGERAVVVNRKSYDVSVFNPADGTGRFRTASGTSPRDFALSRDGRWMFLANFDSNDLSVIDLENAREMGKLPLDRGPESVIFIGR